MKGKTADHEHEMIRRQTDQINSASKRLKKKVGKGEGNVKAWVQSKITKAADYLDTAADYMDSEKVNEGSLRKWFKGSKSKDGKGGWVNVVTGGTCASDEPGEGTPKCVSSSKRASMTKAERKSAAARKKRKDPNQQSKTGAAKPTYVATDKKKKMKESKDLVTISKELDKASKMHKGQANRVRKHIKDMHKEEKQPKNCGCGKDPCITYGKKEMKKESVYSDWKNEELVLEVKDKKGKGSGKKDACYHKIKASAKVWPSAYASGRLVQCRKKGAANYGNKSEGVEYTQFQEKCWDGYKAYGMKKKGGKMVPNCKPVGSVKEETVDEACWKGYEKKGMKTMFGKRYPNCVKKTKKEEVEVDTSSNVSEDFYRKKYNVKDDGYKKTNKMTKSNKRSGDSKAQYREVHKDLANEEMGNISHTKTKKGGKTIINVNKNDELDAQAAMKNDPKFILGKTRVQPYKEGYSANPAQQAAIAIAKIKKKEDDKVAKKMKKEDWRSELGYVEEAKKPMVKVKLKDPSKIKVKVTDIGAGGKEYVRKNEIDEAKSPAWQRKAGKSDSGGLNAKGVASYRAANPGSKLKTAVTTKPSKLKKGSKSANRRKSFCSRMKGMKKKLTSAKTARDPDSRINKSLRKWNC